MNYSTNAETIKKLEENGVKYTIFNKSLYITEGLFLKLQTFIFNNTNTHWNILSLFLDNQTPYYLLFRGQFYINMKKILLAFQQENNEYTIPFLLHFIKNELKIDLSKRKNIYERNLKKNMIYTFIPNETMKKQWFFSDLATKLLKTYGRTHKEVSMNEKYGGKNNYILQYTSREIWIYQKKRGIWESKQN